MIRVSEPLLGGNEKKYLCQAIDEGEISSGGKFVRKFEEAFAKWSGNEYAIAVSSGTAALETALESVIYALGIKDISIPCGTIISCYIAAIRANAKVILRDNDAKPRCENVMRVHLFGKLDNVGGLFNVDDLSQYWNPFKVPDVGCYSLYANKLITSGEGGVIVTNRKYLYDRAISYRNLCHSKERFVHESLGYNFRMSNIQAAVALAQLEQIDKFTEIKQKNRDLYLENLPCGVTPLFKVEVPWMYLIRTEHDAGEMVKAMEVQGIECRRFFYPLNRQPCINLPGEFPKADDLWNHAFYLPSGLNLTEKEIENVCKELRAVLQPF